MKRLFWLAVVVFALGGLVWVVGLFVPRDHEASVSRIIVAPPDRVYAVIADVAAAPTWRRDVDRVELLDPVGGRRHFREHSGGDTMTMAVDADEPNRRRVLRIADPDLPFGGTWTFDLVPEAGGTRVTITERGEVYNPVFRVVQRFVFGYTSTMEGYLDDLAKKLAPGRP